MFVLCFLCSKDKGKMQDKQDKKQVRIRYKREQETKKIPPGAWMFVLCVVEE